MFAGPESPSRSGKALIAFNCQNDTCQKSTSPIPWLHRCIVYCGFGVIKRLSVCAALESRNQNKPQLSMPTSLEQRTAKDLRRGIVLLQWLRKAGWLPAFQCRLRTRQPGTISGKPCSRSNSNLCQKFRSAYTSWLHRAQAQKCTTSSRKEVLSVLDAKLCWRIFCITGLLQKRIWLTPAYKHHSGKLCRGAARALILHIELCVVMYAMCGATCNFLTMSHLLLSPRKKVASFTITRTDCDTGAVFSFI